MKQNNTKRWVVTFVLFIIFYVLTNALFYWLIAGRFSLWGYGSEMKFGILTYVSSIVMVSDPSWGGIAAIMSGGAIVVTLVLFLIARFIAKKLVKVNQF